MINFISLGMSCQTTHQLSFFCEQHASRASFVKGPFDWMICPPDSAAHWLGEGIREFDPGDIVEYRAHAYWPLFKLWFWHGFLNRSGEQPVLDLTQLAGQELSKLNYLRSKFRSLDTSRAVFFISNTQNNLNTEVFEPGETDRYHFDITNIALLESALQEYFSSEINLQVITRTDRATPELQRRENVHLLSEEDSNWKGDKAQWAAVLGKLC